MRVVPGTKYIQYVKGAYNILKRIDGELIYFGRYDSLDEAIKWRDFFMENDWNTDLRLIGTKCKNIYYEKSRYIIVKEIKGKKYYFGSFKTYEEAETRLKQIRLEGFENIIQNNTRLIETTTRNIIRLRNGKYEIRKVINGVLETFGVFNTYEEAEAEVKLLRQCGWDYDILCECIDETIDGGSEFLGEKKWSGKVEFYKPPHGRIDYGIIENL